MNREYINNCRTFDIAMPQYKDDELGKMQNEHAAGKQFENTPFLKLREPTETDDGMMVYAYTVKVLQDVREVHTKFDAEVDAKDGNYTKPWVQVEVIASEDKKTKLGKFTISGANVNLKDQMRKLVTEGKLKAGEVWEVANLGKPKDWPMKNGKRVPLTADEVAKLPTVKYFVFSFKNMTPEAFTADEAMSNEVAMTAQGR